MHEKARTEGKGKRSCPTHKKRHAPIESRLRNIIASFIFLVEADQSASAGACATAAVRLMSAGRADESGGGIHVPGSPSHSGQLFPPHYTRLSHAQMTFKPKFLAYPAMPMDSMAPRGGWYPQGAKLSKF